MQSSSSSNRNQQRIQPQSQNINSIQNIALNPTEHYSSSHLSTGLLSLLSSHGFNRTSTRARSLLNDLFVRYLHLIAKDALSNANHSSRQTPNAKDVEGALENLGTETEDLIRWCRNTRESDTPLDEAKRTFLKERAADLRREWL